MYGIRFNNTQLYLSDSHKVLLTTLQSSHVKKFASKKKAEERAGKLGDKFIIEKL